MHMRLSSLGMFFVLCVVVIMSAGYRPEARADSEGQGFDRRTPAVIAVEKAGPAVANISTERMVTERRINPFFSERKDLFQDFFEDFFGAYERKKVEMPLGSGVLIDPEGYIVTNEHVIGMASGIIVTLSDGSVYEARLVSSDYENDLAVLKVESSEPFPYLEMGTSEDLMIGESVIALGNPFGFKNSVTIGVVSAADRTLTFQSKSGEVKYEGLIQTDALINPGNSGGPLVNINGQLIGINTAIMSRAQGIGFAIPVDKVKKILIGLFDFQQINKVWLGIKMDEPAEGEQGVRVDDVEDGSPAYGAGLRAGDMVLEVDGREVVDVLQFEKYLLKKEVGDRLKLAVERDGRRRDLSLQLDKVPVPSAGELAWSKLGVDVQGLTPEIAERLGLSWLNGGVLITDVDESGPAVEIGLRVGYVITSLGDYNITGIEQLAVLLERVKSGSIVDVGLAWSDGFGAHEGYVSIRAR